LGRELQNGMSLAQVSETHIVFDSAGRVRGMLTATEIRMP